MIMSLRPSTARRLFPNTKQIASRILKTAGWESNTFPANKKGAVPGAWLKNSGGVTRYFMPANRAARRDFLRLALALCNAPPLAALS